MKINNIEKEVKNILESLRKKGKDLTKLIFARRLDCFGRSSI